MATISPRPRDAVGLSFRGLKVSIGKTPYRDQRPRRMAAQRRVIVAARDPRSASWGEECRDGVGGSPGWLAERRAGRIVHLRRPRWPGERRHPLMQKSATRKVC
jgi:hypothetical protein